MAWMPASTAIFRSSLLLKVLGEMMGFERFPIALDVVEFGRIFGHPFEREPVLALGQRIARRFAGVDGSIVQDDGDGFAHRSRLGAMDSIELFEQGYEIGTAFGLRGYDGELAGDEVERAHHGDLW
jgi:hypothetical protein